MKHIKYKYQILFLLLPWSIAFLLIANIIYFLAKNQKKLLRKIVIRIFVIGAIFFMIIPFLITEFWGVLFWFSDSLSWQIYCQVISTLMSIYLIHFQKHNLKD